MKQIGQKPRDAMTWLNWPTQNIDHVDLFVTDEGTQENINAAVWEHIGWVLPGDGANAGGKIYPDKQGSNSVAAYVKRAMPPQPEPFTTRGEINEIKMVIGALAERINRLERLATTDQNLTPKAKEAFIKGVTTDDVGPELMGKARLTVGGNPWPSDAMTFYDHAFIAAVLWQHAYHGKFNVNENCVKAGHDMAVTLTAARRPV